MSLLALDIGSSSVKAALLDGTRVVGADASASFATRVESVRVEVDSAGVDEAIRQVVRKLGERVNEASAIGLTGMAPAWCAMDDRGVAITPIVTHQDRRSLDEARRIESAVGRERHLHVAGNRPTPGGVSSTTAAWFARNTDAVARAARVGHLPTSIVRRLTGEWAVDPSNAGFMGLMDVTSGDWSDELCTAAGVGREKLPPIRDAGEVIGETIGNEFGIPAGLPVVGGFVDGSGAILLAGGEVGTLVHSAGSTDVLALCVPRALPREGLLCRPLGIGGKWVSAATLSSGGSAVNWAHGAFFSHLSKEDFYAECDKALEEPDRGVRFDPRLAGDRQSVDQPTGTLTGLTLATSPRDLLRAVLVSLAEDSGKRVRRLLDLGVPVRREVILTGGLGEAFCDLLHRDWPTPPGHAEGAWRFRFEDEATLRGAGTLWQG